jgi:large subunit ribosomal protein L29
MALTKASDLRTKSVDELKDRAIELRKEQFNLRIQKATGQLANPARQGHVKRELAQIQTLLGEKRRGADKPAPKAGAKTKKKAA